MFNGSFAEKCALGERCLTSLALCLKRFYRTAAERNGATRNGID